MLEPRYWLQGAEVAVAVTMAVAAAAWMSTWAREARLHAQPVGRRQFTLLSRVLGAWFTAGSYFVLYAGVHMASTDTWSRLSLIAIGAVLSGASSVVTYQRFGYRLLWSGHEFWVLAPHALRRRAFASLRTAEWRPREFLMILRDRLGGRVRLPASVCMDVGFLRLVGTHVEAPEVDEITRRLLEDAQRRDRR